MSKFDVYDKVWIIEENRAVGTTIETVIKKGYMGYSEIRYNYKVFNRIDIYSEDELFKTASDLEFSLKSNNEEDIRRNERERILSALKKAVAFGECNPNHASFTGLRFACRLINDLG